LEGVRIIDLTQMIAGPLATMVLADQGADVIKVEPPHGDYTRDVATRRGGYSASFLNNNRNKRSVALDLKKPEGKAALLRLIEGADAFVQNFRPGVADRMGFSDAALRKVSPEIVNVSLCGFGFDGPYAQKPVFDPLIQAVSGLTTVQALSDEDRPRLVRTILPDKLTAIQASQAITAALYCKARTGKGQHVRLSMLDTLVGFLWASDMGGHTFVGNELKQETAQSFIDLIYETQDGYISVATMQNKHWQGLAHAVGRPDFLEDPRFATPQGREVNKDARLELIQEGVRPFTSAEAIERLEAHDVPCAPVLTRREMIRHPQIAANGMVVETEHPDAGRLHQARAAAQFSETPTQIRHGGRALGADTRTALGEAGLSGAEIDALMASGVAVETERGSATYD
jgi:crotonobetainyl-CoA:carnitine CoA-transferase CaiB-like acyl-CoA transferase